MLAQPAGTRSSSRRGCLPGNASKPWAGRTLTEGAGRAAGCGSGGSDGGASVGEARSHSASVSITFSGFRSVCMMAHSPCMYSSPSSTCRAARSSCGVRCQGGGQVRGTGRWPVSQDPPLPASPPTANAVRPGNTIHSTEETESRLGHLIDRRFLGIRLHGSP